MHQKKHNEIRITIDIIFIVLILTVYFFWFYSKWHVGIDQGIHLYTAWGVLNGMKQYVDIIDIHLPGLTLVNIIAWLLGGPFPFGIRIVDIVCLFILFISTSLILSRWKVPLPLRIIAITLYLISYLATGPSETAQKESFALPLVIFGLLPWLDLELKNKCSKTQMLFFGIITALGIWIKITSLLLIIFTLVINYIYSIKNKKEYLNIITFYLIGTGIVSALFIFWIVIIGSWEGFLKWSINYSIGPYMESRWNIDYLFNDFVVKIWNNNQKWPLLYAISGIFIGLLARKSQLKKHKEIIYALGCILASLLSVIIQGKSLQYHFIPLQWSLILFGSVFLSNTNIANIISRQLLLVIFICGTILSYSGTIFSKTLIDTQLKLDFIKSIEKYLQKNDTFVLFGNASFIHSYLQRKTPFPFIASLGLYNMVPPNSPIRKEIIESLINSLKDPSVKLFLLQDRNTLPIHSLVENSRSIVLEQIGYPTLKELGYEFRFQELGFDVYEKVI